MEHFKSALSVLISSLLFTSMAFAQDLFKSAAMPTTPATPYNWTGFYAGLNVGEVQRSINITDTQATTFNATIQQSINPSFTGGFQVGYRRQLDWTPVSGVYGLEFSSNFSNKTFSKEYGSSFATYQLDTKNNLKNVCLLQLLGGLAAEKTFLFIAAGFSWINITGSMTDIVSVPFFNSVSLDKKTLGTSLSGGIEYAFTNKISARIKVDVIVPESYSTYDNLGDNFQVSNNIVQGTFAVNYKLG